ncbi:MAG: pirin-like C-terminal cupin domain-containing protein [Polyangiaceae bacterium]
MPPAASEETIRTLYFFAGSSLRVGGESQKSRTAIVVDPTQSLRLEAGADVVEVLMLQARPIGEPVAQHGPFVMNTRAQIEKAFDDYRRTRFGGWPWKADGPVHPRNQGRFARHANGKVEQKEG